jgi:hypothetical protein
MRLAILIFLAAGLFQCSDDPGVTRLTEDDIIGTWILHTSPAKLDWDTAYCVNDEPICIVDGVMMKCEDLAYQRVMYGYNFQSYTDLEPWEFMIANQFRVVRFGYEMEFADCTDNKISWLALDVEPSPEDYRRRFIGHYTLNNGTLKVWATWANDDEPEVLFTINEVTDSTLVLTSATETLNFKKKK